MSATPQTEAQRLADALEKDKWHVTAVTLCRASDELRRLDAVEAERNELAAKLNVMQGDFSVRVTDEAEIDDVSFVPDESQRLYAIRESIVRAAAEIGKDQP